MVIAEYDGFTKPALIDLNCFKIWIQIHDLPDGYGPLVKPLAAKVGARCDDVADPGDFAGNFYRARVTLDVRKPLKNHVSIMKKQKRQIVKVKYERLPDWCAVCGMLGHLFKECGNGIHPPSALVFKNLKADWFRGPGHGPGVARGFQGGRGRGSGRLGQGGCGSGRTRQENFDPYVDQDTAMEDGDGNRKRGAHNTLLLTAPGMNPSSSMEPQNTSTVVVPQSPASKQDLKRPKTNPPQMEKNQVKSKISTNPNAQTAGPINGSRQAQ